MRRCLALKHRLFLFIIIILTVSAYLNSLHGEPQFDDEYYLFEEEVRRSPYIFKDINMWDAFRSGIRPVTAFTFSLNYSIWGKDTFSYHLTNIFIHLLNGALVYALIHITMKNMHYAQWTAFLATLLFSIHPIQTESVSYMYQRAESLSSLFYLASLLSFIASARYNGLTRLLLISAFIFGFILALGSKETAITLPVIASLYGLYFFERKGLWKNLLAPGSLMVIGGVVAVVRLTAVGINPSAGYHLKEFTAWEYLLTQFSAVAAYLRLLIFPVGQSIDHLYPISRSFWEARPLAGLGLLVIVFLTALSLRKRWRAGSFFIIWFFITLMPSSSIFPLKDAFAEHRLYLPAVGIFFILASGMVKVSQTVNKRVVLASLVIAVSALLWTATFHRNNLWNSRLAMWQDAIRKSPQNARAHYNVGTFYLEAGDYNNAVKEYINTLDLDPENMEAYYNIGLSFEKLGVKDLARDFLIVFVRFGPKDIVSKIGDRILKYNITENTAVSDVKMLRQRAIDAVK